MDGEIDRMIDVILISGHWRRLMMNRPGAPSLRDTHQVFCKAWKLSNGRAIEQGGGQERWGEGIANGMHLKFGGRVGTRGARRHG